MKLLTILGAGSSVAQKMPSVAQVDALMRTWSAAYVLAAKDGDYYNWLTSVLTAYYANEPKAALRSPVNFEVVLGFMASLQHLTRDAPYGDPLAQLVPGHPHLPPAIANAPSYGVSQAIHSQLTNLLDKMAKHFRTCSLGLNTGTREFQNYVRLLSGLAREFDLGVHNLNYDDVARSALPNAFCGFDAAGSFDPASVHTRAGWGFLYHLHGSVHHCLAGDFGDSISWENQLSGAFVDAPAGLSQNAGADGRSFARSTLIAGGYKLDRLMTEPFATFHASLIRHVYEADAVLLGGYGFGDSHVNWALQNRLAQVGSRPRIAVLTFSPDECDPMAFRGDAWGHQLCGVLETQPSFVDARGGVAPPSIRDLKAADSFEVSAGNDVAIWHGGFETAARRVKGLTAWLKGGPSTGLLA